MESNQIEALKYISLYMVGLLPLAYQKEIIAIKPLNVYFLISCALLLAISHIYVTCTVERLVDIIYKPDYILATVHCPYHIFTFIRM